MSISLQEQLQASSVMCNPSQRAPGNEKLTTLKKIEKQITTLRPLNIHPIIHRFLCVVLVFSCGQPSTKQKEEGIAKTKANSARTETGKDSTFIDDYIINAIIGHYKDNTTKMATEISDTLLTVSFRNIPTKDNDFDGIGLAIHISKMKKDYILGDLDHDGIPDLIADISTEGGGGGGNVWWNDLFVFLSRKGKYVLTSVTESPSICGCTTGDFYPDKIQDGLILGKSICWAENDPHCCPSLNYLTTVSFDGKQLQYKK